MRNAFLVSETTYYYDGHGDCDPGEHNLYVSRENWYAELDTNLSYHDLESAKNYVACKYEYNLDDPEEKKEYLLDREQYVSSDNSAQDGYNASDVSYSIVMITEKEAVKYEKIIEDYNNLIKLFSFIE